MATDNFEAGLSAWTTDGAVRSFEQAGNHLAALEEPGAGSRSRLYRADIAVPVTPTHLSFRYYFSYAPRVRESAVPPDSFSAYFLDASGNRLIVPGGTRETRSSDAGGGENVVTVPSFHMDFLADCRANHWGLESERKSRAVLSGGTMNCA